MFPRLPFLVEEGNPGSERYYVCVIYQAHFKYMLKYSLLVAAWYRVGCIFCSYTDDERIP